MYIFVNQIFKYCKNFKKIALNGFLKSQENIRIIGTNRQTDMRGHREVSLPLTNLELLSFFDSFKTFALIRNTHI